MRQLAVDLLITLFNMTTIYKGDYALNESVKRNAPLHHGFTLPVATK